MNYANEREELEALRALDIAPVEENEREELNKLRMYDLEKRGVDIESGADIRVRSAVGDDTRNPGDRLATLQNFYPDAKPFGDGNFVYTNEQGKETLYNPEGWVPEVGDFAEYGRELVGGVAAIPGAIAGSAVGPAGTIAGGAGGYTAGATFWDAMNNIANKRVDSRTVGDLAGDTAKDLAIGAAGEAGGLVAGKALKGMFRGTAKDPEATIRQMEQAGIPLEGNAAAIVDSKPMSILEDVTSNTFGGGRVDAARDATLKAIEKRAGGLASSTGGKVQTTTGMGDVIAEGIEGSQKRFKDTLSGRLKEFDGVGESVSPTNTVNVLDELEKELADSGGSKTYLNKAIKQAKRIAGEDNTLTIGDMSDLRTDLGGKLELPAMSGGYVGKEGQAVRKVYNSLKEDLYSSLEELEGGEELLASRKALDADITTYNKEVVPFQKKFGKKESNKVYKSLIDGDVKHLKMAKQELGEEAWNDMKATTIGKLGEPTPGSTEDFSIDRFVTKWNKMSPESKGVLFEGELGDSLDDLVSVVNKLKKSRRLGANPSGTAKQVSMNTLMVGAMFYNPAVPLGTAAAAKVSSTLLTSPWFIKWLAKAPATRNGIQQHLGRLGAMVKGKPELEEWYEGYKEEVLEKMPKRKKSTTDKEDQAMNTLRRSVMFS